MQSLPLSCTVVEWLCWLLPRRFSNTSARLLCFCREVQGQGWNQPREIEVSILYRNAVWALQAGKFKGSIGIQSLHTQVRFWEEKQSLSSGLAPVQTTTEASALGWELLRLESLILRAAPSCLLVESTQVLGPQTLANSCVLSSGKYQGVRVFLGVFVDSRRRGPPCAPSHLKGVVRKGVPRKSEAERFFCWCKSLKYCHLSS